MAIFSKELNSTQSQAVTQTKGPCLILAGAGSGKTRVLTYRIAYLITQGLARPSEVLAVTFTNKAAQEMRDRVVQLLETYDVPTLPGDLWISTFHSLCARILRSHITRLGYEPFFTIYDDSDQLQVIKKALKNLNIDEKTYTPKSFKFFINTAKTFGSNPENVSKKCPDLVDDRKLKVFTEYEKILKNSNALDFNDLLLKTYELLVQHEDVLELYQNQFKFLMVDEYQDTNRTQYLLVQMLSKKHRNLCVVGDEDQSIYSWRGADIGNILDFEEDFPETQVIKLEENYRSTKNIISSASALIQNNTQRKEKTLFTNNTDGTKIKIRGERNDLNEAQYVAQNIMEVARNANYDYKEFAIFYRTNAQSRALEDQFRSLRVPYRIIGGLSFYERKEIKDILAYMKLVVNSADDVALKRIINVPARAIGKKTIDTLEDWALKQQTPLFQACQNVQMVGFNPGTTKKIENFVNLIYGCQKKAQAESVLETAEFILDSTGYIKKLQLENTDESQGRIENLEEFYNVIAQFEKERGDEATLENFLEELSLASSSDQTPTSDDSVSLMTLHTSKGLEFKNVYMVGLEENLFPSGASNEDPDGLEEERRLAYVGMTRAMENLTLTYAGQRRVWGQEQYHEPSRFLQEIPKEYIEFSGTHSKWSQSRKPQTEDFDSDFDDMPDYEEFSDEEFEGYKKGMRVRHPTFGIGSILRVEGSGEEQKVDVMFSNQRSKKFMAKFARLERV